MSFCSAQILDLAESTYVQMGSPTDQSVGYISGVYSSSGFLGGINNRLGICTWISGDSPCIVGFGPDEATIADLVYRTNFYEKAALSALAGGATMWVQLREGDSVISRSSMVEVAKAYNALYKTANDQLTQQITYWTLNHSTPGSIDSAQVFGFPSP